MEAGKHGYSGGCSPDSVWKGHFDTFSYGIFEWLPKSGGKGVKKSAVKVRVSGSVGNADAVTAKTEEIVGLLDDGKYTGPKYVKVK